MEGEVCHYNKFGFCKYKEECRRRHFSEECEHLSTCKSISSCMKRHPRPCKKFASGQCKYKNHCAYKHLEPKENREQSEMIEKVKQLEKSFTCSD
jgi:hypothetical protein